jgi:hypothetical protein
MTDSTTLTDETHRCEDCGWQAPIPLVARAREAHGPEGSAEYWLSTAHCCACIAAGCPCGGH